MNSLTIKVYIASGYNAGKGKLILNNVEYPFDNVMPDSDNAYELYFGFANPITLPVTGQLFITNASDEIEPFDHNGTIQVNQGYAIYNYDYNNPCYMEFELEEDGQTSGDPSIEFGSVSDPWYYNPAHVSSCNTLSHYEIKCSFIWGGSARPAKTFIRWGTNEPYTQITCSGGNVDSFSWQEQSVPYDEIGTLVVEFTDANDNGLTVDSYSSQNYVFDTDTDGSYGGTRLLIKSPDGSNIYDYAAGNFIECNITLENAQPVVYENTVVFTGATVSQVDIDADNGEGYVTFNVVNNTIQFDDGDYWYIKNLITSTGKASAITITDPNGNSQNYSITNPNAPLAEYIRECAGTWTVNVDSVFPYDIPNLTGRRFGNAENEESWYFTAQNAVHYQNGCGEGATSIDLNITAWIWNPNGWPQIGWTMQTDGDLNYYYDPVEDKFYDNYTDYYPEIYYDPCNPPQPTEKHIYLCDNSGAHLAEMTNTGSTWSVSGAFTSGQYSIRATVEGEYNDAWFKFYQTSGDNRVFVGAGDDPSFEDIGTYIMIDDILTSFSLTEDQETGYYVVNYQNTGAMTVSTVETIVNNYTTEQGFVTGSDIAAMSYITMTDVESCGYIDQTSLSNMAYVDSTSLSNMSYVDNTYLSTYMNAVVGDINSILQTI